MAITSLQLLLHYIFCACIVLSLGLGQTNGQPETYRTIIVDQSGHGNFRTIQSAIDSIPSNNNKWICIYITAGEYRERVTIPRDKPFVYLKGEGKRKTIILWDAHGSITSSATFTSEADNIVAKGISFKNSYNNPPTNKNPVKVAVAAMIVGDKSAFYGCGFFGFQDTLWDVGGRHYFNSCTIEGAIDFIFGAGKSIYERSSISVIAGALNGGGPGFVTAQARSSKEETNGFIFKDCNVFGNGKTYLGRAWRAHARVIYYNTDMSNIVVPSGWDAWHSVGKENQLFYAEYGCKGLGSNNSSRVEWEKKLDQKTLSLFISMEFIDNEGWISAQAFNLLA